MKTKFSKFVKNMKIKKETLKATIKKKREQSKQKKYEGYSIEFSKEFGDLESEDDYTEQIVSFVPKYVISTSDEELNYPYFG